MNATTRFALPLLAAGQAQKELTHNEALTLLDALVQACVESVGDDTPPADPEPGQCWIVGEAPAGAWSGAGQALAVWTDGGWRFAAPREGMRVTLRADQTTASYADGGWTIGVVAANQFVVAGDQVVSARQPAIAVPAGGTIVDDEARSAIAAMLHALREHGLIAA